MSQRSDRVRNRTPDPWVGSGQRRRWDARRSPRALAVRPLAAAPSAAAVVLGWLGLRGGNVWLELLACGCLAPLLASLDPRPGLGRLEVELRMPNRAVVGEDVEVELRIRNDAVGASPAASVVVEVAGHQPLQVAVPPLAGDGEVRVLARTVARHRTRAARQRVRMISAAPFGLVERRRTVVVELTVVVHPKPAPPVRLTGPAHAAGPASPAVGLHDRSGQEPYALREWRPGDSTRQVHWRGTARRGRLVVAEPERTRGPRMALLVAGDVTSPQWEAVLARAAATAVVAARLTGTVLLLARDPDGDPLETADPVAILDWCAALGSPVAPGPRERARLRSWLWTGGDLLMAGTDASALVSWWQPVVGDPSPSAVRVTTVPPAGPNEVDGAAVAWASS